jgi:hypothetical protein
MGLEEQFWKGSIRASFDERLQGSGLRFGDLPKDGRPLKVALPRNLWVDFGSGKAPSIRYRATSTALNVRNPYDFLVVSFRRLSKPSMTPLETVFLAEVS